MSRCTEQEVERLLPLVSDQRRQQALRFRHLAGRYACLQSYRMLQQLMECDTLPPFEYNTYGQPYWPDGSYFSISHCRTAIAVVVSDRPVGIDVESVRKGRPELIARTMNEREQQEISASADPAKAFIRLWTQKEAVLKCRGTGIVDDLHSVLLPDKIADLSLRTWELSDAQTLCTICEANTPE